MSTNKNTIDDINKLANKTIAVKPANYLRPRKVHELSREQLREIRKRLNENYLGY